MVVGKNRFKFYLKYSMQYIYIKNFSLKALHSREIADQTGTLPRKNVQSLAALRGPSGTVGFINQNFLCIYIACLLREKGIVFNAEIKRNI